MLLMRPAGEPRTAYFYCRRGQEQATLAYLEEHFAGAAVAWPTEVALNAGLLGPQPHSARTYERLGDIVVAMRGQYALYNPDERKRGVDFVALHGGMAAGEMEVPWLGLRLDA
jgi:hypothetical protein